MIDRKTVEELLMEFIAKHASHWIAAEDEFDKDLNRIIEASKSTHLYSAGLALILKRIEDMHPYKESGNRDSYSEYNEGWSDACDILGQAIKELLNK